MELYAKSALSWIKKSTGNQNQAINEIEKIENSTKSLSGLVESSPNKNDLIPTSFHIGSKVQSTLYNWVGHIKSINHSDQTVEVQVGKISYKVSGNQISIIEENIDQSKPNFAKINLISSTNIQNIEIDIRGIRVSEAQDKLEVFLDQSLREGLTQVRIIHGKGSGALRSTVKQILSKHPLVKTFDQETDSKGEVGSTKVTLI